MWQELCLRRVDVGVKMVGGVIVGCTFQKRVLGLRTIQGEGFMHAQTLMLTPTDWQRDVILGLMEDKRQLSNEVEVLKRKLMESVVLGRKKDTEKIMLKMNRTRVSLGLKCEVWVICALLAILLFWYFILT